MNLTNETIGQLTILERDFSSNLYVADNLMVYGWSWSNTILLILILLGLSWIFIIYILFKLKKHSHSEI